MSVYMLLCFDCYIHACVMCDTCLTAFFPGNQGKSAPER